MILSNLSDLLDTHQVGSTEVRHRNKVKIITTPWTAVEAGVPASL